MIGALCLVVQWLLGVRKPQMGAANNNIMTKRLKTTRRSHATAHPSQTMRLLSSLLSLAVLSLAGVLAQGAKAAGDSKDCEGTCCCCGCCGVWTVG